jgi:cell division protein FtsL
MAKENIENQNKTQKQTVAYSALTFVLLIFIIQTGFGMVINILRNIDTIAKLKIVSNAHKYAKTRNYNLKYEMQSFNSAKNLESIARNNLKMAGENEILLVINKQVKDDSPKDKKKIKKEKGIFLKEH